MDTDFITRIKHILALYELSPSVFADEIGIQRSSMSHLLSGRNKPSLDFVLKTTAKFPDINLYWLLKGEGASPSRFENEPSLLVKNDPHLGKNKVAGDKKVSRVIIFYEDGTFEPYNPNQ